MVSLLKRAEVLIGLIFLISLGLIVGALLFQHVGGLAPCDLCYKQRWVYYMAVAVLPFGLYLHDQNQHQAVRILMFIFAAAFFANMILGIYHAGVEWKFWDGPADCADIGQLDDTIGVIEAMSKGKVIPCGEAQWRLLGISMAGYSALASLVLGIISLLASQVFFKKP